MKSLLTAAFLCCTLSVSAQMPSWLPTNGLVAWYPFTGDALDSSGNGNHGTVMNATLAADRFGNPNSCYSFNGYNSRIEVPDAPGLRVREISLALWVKSSAWQIANLVYKSDFMTSAGESYFSGQ